MSINLTNKQFGLAVVVAVMVMVLSFVLGSHSIQVEPVVEVQEVVKYVEVIREENFDTSVLESWEGDFSDGKIRMIGAWLYGQDNEGNPIVIDERGELWTLSGYEVDSEDFLLLWIVDNNSPENVHDDMVLKIWTEKYEKVVYEEVG